MSNPGLKENFGKLEMNMRKLSSSSKNEDAEGPIKKQAPGIAQESLLKEHKTEDYNYSRLPTSESLGGIPHDSSMQDQSLQESLAQYLLFSMASDQVPQNAAPTAISPQVEMFLQTQIMKDLFLNAFKRFLQSTKETIRSNLFNILAPSGAAGANQAPLAQDDAEKRKKSDLLSNETIESDKNRLNSSFQRADALPLSQRRNLNFSSFKRASSKNGPMLGYPQKQEDSDSWDPKEEKKQ